MRVLVTGGFGYIGSHLFDYLSQWKDFTVKRLPYKVNILDKKGLSAEIEKFYPEVTVHCAALVSTVLCDFAGKRLSTQINVEGTRNVAAVSNEIESRMVYLGSTASYKPTPKLITEDMPSKPRTIYGQTKYEGEKVVKEFGDNLILRLAYVFGRNDRVSNIGALIRAQKEKRIIFLHAAPDVKKDYLYADECMAALSLAIKQELTGFYNISRQDPRKFSEIMAYLKKCGINPTVYLRPEKDYLGTHVVSSRKFRKKTGWLPRITVEEGIALCL